MKFKFLLTFASALVFIVAKSQTCEPRCFQFEHPLSVFQDSTFWLKIKVVNDEGSYCDTTINPIFITSSSGINGVSVGQVVENGIDSFLISIPNTGYPVNLNVLGFLRGLCDTTLRIFVLDTSQNCLSFSSKKLYVPDSMVVNGHNASGNFIDTLIASNGCDSIIFLDLNHIVTHAYGPHPLQKFDVYGSGNRATLWIHGGGFRSGDKSNFGLTNTIIRDTSEVYIPINYRLLSDSTCGLQSFEDCKMAIDSVKKVYTNIHVVGSSAGGMAALWACMQTKVNSVTLVNTPATTDYRYWKMDTFPSILSTIGNVRNNEFFGVTSFDGIDDELEMQDLYFVQFDAFIYMDSTDTPIIVKKIDNASIGSFGKLVHHQGHNDLIVEAAILFGVPIDSIP